MRRTISIAAAAAAGAVGGGAPATARADACAADAKGSWARVEIYRELNCVRPSVSVGFTGNGDRPDFAAFLNHEGLVYDVDNSRSSLALAAATCVRLFDGRDFTGADSGLLCAPADATGFFADLGAMNDVASSMRLCPLIHARRLRPARRPAASTAAARAEREPGEPRTRGCRRRSCATAAPGARSASAAAPPCGWRSRTSSAGRSPARRLQVRTLEARAGAEARACARRHHRRRRQRARDARARPLAPSAGRVPRPRRRRAARLDGRRAARACAPASRCGYARAGCAAAGRSACADACCAAPAPGLGKVVTLQARERGRWRDFKSARTRAGGRFAARYRFSRGARGTFPIRAVARAEAAYPYATGRSRTVRVRVG